MNKLTIIFEILLLGTCTLILSTGSLKSRNSSGRFVFTFFLAISILELFSEVIFADIPNNLFLYHFFCPLELFIIGYFFFTTTSYPILKKVIIPTIIIFSVLSLIISIEIQHLTQNNDIQILTQSGLQIIFCLFSYHQILTKDISIPPHKNHQFWITTGILFYSIDQFFIEGLLAFLVKKDIIVAFKWYAYSFIFKYFMCILCFVGIIQLKRSKQDGH